MVLATLAAIGATCSEWSAALGVEPGPSPWVGAVLAITLTALVRLIVIVFIIKTYPSVIEPDLTKDHPYKCVYRMGIGILIQPRGKGLGGWSII